MRIAVYPGSFDPPTNGHIDIIYRATVFFDKVIVAITDSLSKKPAFSKEERIGMLRKSTEKMTNIEIDCFTGLLVDYLKEKKARIIIRGLRAVSDFEYEFQMALMNRQLNSSIETIFLIPDEAYTYLSSSLVKEVAQLGGSVAKLVPPAVEKKIKELLLTIKKKPVI